MKKMILLALVSIIFYECKDNMEISPFSETKKATARFWQYNMTLTDNNAYQEDYIFILPNLLSFAVPEQSFLRVKETGDTLKITRECYPEKTGDIDLLFSTAAPKDSLGLLKNNGRSVNPDEIRARAEKPGLSGDSELRFYYKKEFIYQHDLRLLDSLLIYYQKDNTWHKEEMSRNDILTTIRLEMQTIGNHGDPKIYYPFTRRIGNSEFSIEIKKEKIEAIKL